MWLKAYPRAIVADGRSDTIISAEVRDYNGRAVPDGTQVDFTATRGIIERSARTSAGVARVRLQSSLDVCTSVVSAVVIGTNAVAQIRIDFLAPGTEMFDESFISFTAKGYLAYDMNRMLINAENGVEVRSRGLEISAHSAQMEARRSIIRARAKMGGENIVLRRGNKRLEASLLYYDFMNMSGYIITPVDDGAKRLKFRARDFYTEPYNEDEEEDSLAALREKASKNAAGDEDKKSEKKSKKSKKSKEETKTEEAIAKADAAAAEAAKEPQRPVRKQRKDNFRYLPDDEESIYIKAKTIIVKPEEEVKFKKAEFYMLNKRLVRMPLYAEPLRGGRRGVNQVISYGQGGLALNIPVYYSLTNSTTGAMHIKKGNSKGWGAGTGKSPWQLDFVQDYNIGAATEGTVTFENVTHSKEWGLSWNQRKELSHNERLYTYLDFPRHDSLYASADFTKSLEKHTWNLSVRGNNITTPNDRYYASTYIRSVARPLFNDHVSYIYDARANYNTGINDPGRSKFGTGLGLQLYGKQLNLSENTSVSTSFSASRNFGADDDTLLWGNVGLYQSFGAKGRVSLNYNYTHDKGKYISSQNRQTLTTDMSWNPTRKLELYGNATYGLGDGDLSAFWEANYTFLPGWRLRLFGNAQHYSGWSGHIIEVGIAKYIAGHEVMLLWGSDTEKVRLEFNAASF